ncbi:transposase [Penicillium cosmopolitanum]|uniref:Transposase n=1 Tax=Penicillium cosmopolitanum TaxID=1131564 RepID=A0A9W9W6H7_9EURO|nr:transposase [Penicillium cosmopolitanum]KAJ5404394.1 transposase [Penicillium cosmopolitanum]
MSPYGWIPDDLALTCLSCFIEAIGNTDRLKRRESAFLYSMVIKCEVNSIILFVFQPHLTHFCWLLDGKPFLNYKQQFRMMNNDLAFWSGLPYGGSDFLAIIGPIREKALTQRIIRESFKDRGI